VRSARRARVSGRFASATCCAYSRRCEYESLSNTRFAALPPKRLGQLLRQLDLPRRVVVADLDPERVADRDARLGHDRLLHTQDRAAAHPNDRAPVGHAVERGGHRDASLAAERLDHPRRHLDEVSAASAARFQRGPEARRRHLRLPTRALRPRAREAALKRCRPPIGTAGASGREMPGARRAGVGSRSPARSPSVRRRR
jgi:hypothetical protein